MGLDRTTLTRTLRPLIKRGFISDIAEDNARNRSLHLTGKGKDAMNSATPLWKKAQTDVSECIGEDNAKLMIELLNKLEEIAEYQEGSYEIRI